MALVWYYMCEDVPITKVTLTEDTIFVEDLAPDADPYDKAFPGQTEVSWEEYEAFLESRCFDRNRPDRDRILKRWGLPEYYSDFIVQETHGVMMSDTSWIRFEGENLTWKEVNPGRPEE